MSKSLQLIIKVLLKWFLSCWKLIVLFLLCLSNNFCFEKVWKNMGNKVEKLVSSFFPKFCGYFMSLKLRYNYCFLHCFYPYIYFMLILWCILIDEIIKINVDVCFLLLIYVCFYVFSNIIHRFLHQIWKNILQWKMNWGIWSHKQLD